VESGTTRRKQKGPNETEEDFLMEDPSDSENDPPKKSRKPRPKRQAGAFATTAAQQMNALVREKLDAVVSPLETAQAMSRPRARAAGYEYDSNSSLSETTNTERHFPVVAHGLFCFTEQRANPNGGGKNMGGYRKKPLLSMFSGSAQMSKELRKVVELIKQNKFEVRIHDTYEDHKNAIFGDKTIKQPQTNKAKERKERASS
jgi:hypothetical protein